MSVEPHAQRLFQSSDGITAVAICPWSLDQSSQVEGFGYEFKGQPDPTHDWNQIFADIISMFRNVNKMRTVDQIQVNLDRQAVVVERRDEWLVLVGVTLGHPIRKSLRRMFNQTFRRLSKLRSATVIPLPRQPAPDDTPPPSTPPGDKSNTE